MVVLRSGKRYGNDYRSNWLAPLAAVGGSMLASYAAKKISSSGGYKKPIRIEGSKRSVTSPALYGGAASKGYTRQYRYKKQSRKKRYTARKRMRRYRSMYNKVSGVANQKMVRNNEIFATATGNDQGWCATHAWTYSGSLTYNNETDLDDVKALRSSMTNTVYTDDITNATKFMLKGCVMDTTLHNTGDNKLEIDKYHIVYRDNVEYAGFTTLLSDANSKQNSLSSVAATKVALTTRGATMFDLPELVSMGYIKILSKEKIFLGSGEFCNFKDKYKLNQSITLNEINADNTYFARKGWTHSHIYVFKKVVASTGTTSQLTIGCTRSYSWFVEGENTPGTYAD